MHVPTARGREALSSTPLQHPFSSTAVHARPGVLPRFRAEATPATPQTTRECCNKGSLAVAAVSLLGQLPCWPAAHALGDNGGYEQGRTARRPHRAHILADFLPNQPTASPGGAQAGPHRVADLHRPHVAAHLHHRAAHLGARHKGQLWAVLVQALQRARRTLKSCTQFGMYRSVERHMHTLHGVAPGQRRAVSKEVQTLCHTAPVSAEHQRS